MTWFLFIGDMLVMLFMVILVVWVSASASRSTLDYSARIPLDDEYRTPGSVVPEAEPNQKEQRT